MILPPLPESRLAEGDRLGFAGIRESVEDLQRIRGLAQALLQETGPVVEAAIAANSPLGGRKVRDARFRTAYNAAIVAVHRNGAAIHAKIGEIELKAGDTLLQEASHGFAETHRNLADFYLVSPIAGLEDPRHNRLRRSVAVLAFLVIGSMLAPVEPVVVCMSAALPMVWLRCLNVAKALASISLPIVVAIASALGMSVALEQTGAAATIAPWLLNICQEMGSGKAACSSARSSRLPRSPRC